MVQEVLLRPCVWKASAGSLSVPQLFQALQELFQRARVETPGQAPPRASELTLSLLMAMFDSAGTGVLELLPLAAALIALSGDSPQRKYRALFQLYAENNNGGYGCGARITRRVLRNLLMDLQQIPTVVGESRTLSSVDSAVHCCFQGVLSPGIKEEKFLSWVQSEPVILRWLPTCCRLSATEMVTQPVRCSICRTFPSTGLRYRCLKCLNFDICQVCFLSGLHSESHRKSHPDIEHWVQQMSAKENRKLLLRTLRNHLLQGRGQRKGDLRRPWLLNEGKPEDPAHHAQAKLLKKQLNRCKDKLRDIYTLQEEKSCRFETKIQELTSNQDSLWSKLQQMQQDVQAMLQPFQPSSSCQHMVSKFDHSSADRFWKGGDSSQIKNTPEGGPGWKPPPNPALVDRSQANADRAPPDSESPATMVQTTRAQSYTRKIPKKSLSSLPSSHQGLLQDKPQSSPHEMTSTALASAGRKEIINAEERKEELKEEELQELLSKLMDAFNLEMPSGPRSSVNMDLYGGAERLCGAFSALVDQITLPNLK
ncbi:dystrotelin [Erethizon dorsatum]